MMVGPRSAWSCGVHWDTLRAEFAPLFVTSERTQGRWRHPDPSYLQESPELSGEAACKAEVGHSCRARLR